MSQDALIPLQFPCGQGGMNRSKNFAQYPETDLPMSESITTEGNTWRKEGGASKINAVSFGVVTVLGHHDFWSGANPSVHEDIVVLSDGRIIARDEAGNVTTIKTDFGNGFPVFAEGWNGSTKALYIANGQRQIQVYTGGGSAAVDIPAPNSDWNSTNGFPIGIFQHRARMIAYGYAARPHDVFASLATNHGDFANVEAFRQEVGPGVGDSVRAGFSWRERAYFLKSPVGLHLLDDSDPNIASWSTPLISEAVGAAGPACCVAVDDDVLILGQDALFYSLNQVPNQGQQSATPILPLETSDFIREELNTDRLDLVRMIWYANKRQVHIAAPAVGSSINNRRIIGDLQSGKRVQIHYSRRDVCSALSLRRATRTSVLRPVIGDNAGFLWALDQASRSKDGAGYRGQFETPPRTFFEGGIRRGNVAALEVVFAQMGEFDLNVEVHLDGKLSQTLTFSQQSAGGAVGSVSFDGDVLGGLTMANRRRKAGGNGTRVKLIGYNAIAGQDFSVQDLLILHTPGNSRK